MDTLYKLENIIYGLLTPTLELKSKVYPAGYEAGQLDMAYKILVEIHGMKMTERMYKNEAMYKA